MSDIKIIDEQEEKPQIKEIADPEKIQQDGLLLLHEVAELFDFKNNEMLSNKRELQTLIEFAKLKTEDHSTEGIKWALRDFSMRLGTPPMAEKLIHYMYRYAKLALQGYEIEKEKERFIK